MTEHAHRPACPAEAGHYRGPQLFAYGAAILVAALFAVALLGIPIQISDSLTEFLAMQAQSFSSVAHTELAGGGPYFRPGKRMTIKLLFDLSGGNFYWWYRGFHALEMLILATLDKGEAHGFCGEDFQSAERQKWIIRGERGEKTARGLRQRGSDYRCCIPALAGFVSPQSIAPDGAESSREEGHSAIGFSPRVDRSPPI